PSQASSESADISQKSIADRIGNLVSLIEFELGRIASADARAGWTKWALIGASGAMVWTLLDQLHEEIPKLHIVIWIYTFVTLVSYGFSALATVLNVDSLPIARQPRFIVANRHLGQMRESALVSLVRETLILAGLVIVPPPVSTWTKFVLVSY